MTDGANSQSNQGGSADSGGQQQNEGNDGGQQQQSQGQQSDGGSQSQEGAFDPKTASPEQLAAVLDNPNFWQLNRVKELQNQAAEGQKLKKQQEKATEDQLKEQKKWEELAAKRGEDLEKANKTIQELTVNQELSNKLTPLGVVDISAALKLIDRTKIEVGEDGNVKGIDEAIEALKTGSPYLFNGSQSGGGTVGNPTNPANGGGSGDKPTFKASQLRGPEGAKFYQEHRKEILEAQAAGRIEQD